MIYYTMPNINCIVCGVEFHIPPARIKTAKFCSRECGAIHKSESVGIDKEYPCKQCGKLVSRYPSEIKKKGVFCTKECFYKYKTIHEYDCKNCGKHFHGGTVHTMFCCHNCHTNYTRKRIDPNKRLAREMVNNAIKSGRLKKGVCVVCGEVKVHGHHEDYLKPLEVIWLCQKHHNDKHRHHPIIFT